MLASSGATDDGTAYVTYNADDYDHYGFLQFFPAATHPNGTMRAVYDVDSREYLGSIPEAPATFNVVHYANEHGVAIGESTFGGVAILSPPFPGSIIDYGSLMTIALQRSKTARELIATMYSLCMEYGYASSGESYSISDGDEAWIMEMVGRGPHSKGCLYVARRLPDGFVTAHANQARITTWPRDDPDNNLWSADIVDVAKALGLYPATGSDADFSFSDTFDPVSPGSAVRLSACSCASHPTCPGHSPHSATHAHGRRCFFLWGWSVAYCLFSCCGGPAVLRGARVVPLSKRHRRRAGRLFRLCARVEPHDAHAPVGQARAAADAPLDV